MEKFNIGIGSKVETFNLDKALEGTVIKQTIVTKFCRKENMCTSRRRTRFFFSKERTIHKSLSVLYLFFLCFTEANASEQQASYRPLIPKERREVQKEILSVMGLQRRPRPTGDPAKGLQQDSAPLYMIGLYNTESKRQRAEIFEKPKLDIADSDEDSHPDFPQKRHSPQSQPATVEKAKGYFVGPFSNAYPYDEHVDVDLDWHRYTHDYMQAFWNEVGIPEDLAIQGRRPIGDIPLADDAFVGNSLEQNLLGNADVIMSFAAKNRGNSEVDEATRAHLKRHRAFYFDVSQIPKEDVLTAARFRLYKDISDNSLGNTTLRVNVYNATHDSNRRVTLELLEGRLVRTSQEGWLVFDVVSACRNWLSGDNHNLGLRVAVETLQGHSVNLNKAGIVGRRGDSSKQAFLVSFLTQGTDSLPRRFRRRSRRGASRYPEEEDDDEMDEDRMDGEGDFVPSLEEEELDDDEIDGEDNELDIADENPDEFDIGPTQSDNRRTKRSRKGTKSGSKKGRGGSRKKTKNENDTSTKSVAEACHREKLYVNFQDLNWDAWIIAPSGYKAYRCVGACQFPLSNKMNATNHAIVQTLVHLLQPDQLPQPCCSPTNLDAISVLYYDDDNNVVYKKYKEMVVRDCGCR